VAIRVTEARNIPRNNIWWGFAFTALPFSGRDRAVTAGRTVI